MLTARSARIKVCLREPFFEFGGWHAVTMYSSGRHVSHPCRPTEYRVTACHTRTFFRNRSSVIVVFRSAKERLHCCLSLRERALFRGAKGDDANLLTFRVSFLYVNDVVSIQRKGVIT